ncbi:unnamed protein product, partial [Meganyctiphanes norvegica]
ISPSSILFLRMIMRGFIRALLVFVRKIAGISSGPGPEFSFSFSIAFSISFSVNIISVKSSSLKFMISSVRFWFMLLAVLVYCALYSCTNMLHISLLLCVYSPSFSKGPISFLLLFSFFEYEKSNLVFFGMLSIIASSFSILSFLLASVSNLSVSIILSLISSFFSFLIAFLIRLLSIFNLPRSFFLSLGIFFFPLFLPLTGTYFIHISFIKLLSIVVLSYVFLFFNNSCQFIFVISFIISSQFTLLLKKFKLLSPSFTSILISFSVISSAFIEVVISIK